MIHATPQVECDQCHIRADARLSGQVVELPRDWIITRPVFNTQNQTKHFCSAGCFQEWLASRPKPPRVKVTD